MDYGMLAKSRAPASYTHTTPVSGNFTCRLVVKPPCTSVINHKRQQAFSTFSRAGQDGCGSSNNRCHIALCWRQLNAVRFAIPSSCPSLKPSHSRSRPFDCHVRNESSLNMLPTGPKIGCAWRHFVCRVSLDNWFITLNMC